MFSSSITQIKIPSPRTDSIASHTHLLARKRQGSLINSTSQAAFLTKMSRWYYGKRDNRKRGEKCTTWSQYAFLPKKEREREKQKEAKKPWTLTHNTNPVTIPETGISSHSHLLIILRKKIFP